VFSLAADGQTAGTGSGIDVRPNGDVLVYDDNGEALSIGAFAPARFRSEAALVQFGEGWGMTPKERPPAARHAAVARARHDRRRLCQRLAMTRASQRPR
jgi:hypothetical protein